MRQQFAEKKLITQKSDKKPQRSENSKHRNQTKTQRIDIRSLRASNRQNNINQTINKQRRER